ncbi:MAG: hypothetical protein U5K38_09290 [Woeseiaceae bacterium]|nr:hypothetical protein [Woeseiaceae bacterium]
MCHHLEHVLALHFDLTGDVESGFTRIAVGEDAVRGAAFVGQVFIGGDPLLLPFGAGRRQIFLQGFLPSVGPASFVFEHRVRGDPFGILAVIRGEALFHDLVRGRRRYGPLLRQGLVRALAKYLEAAVSENAITLDKDFQLPLRVRLAEGGVCRSSLRGDARVRVSAALKQLISILSRFVAAWSRGCTGF